MTLKKPFDNYIISPTHICVIIGNSNIFGSNSSDDDKWIIYTRCAMALAHVDGETSEEEVHGTVARLHQRKEWRQW